MQTIILEFFIQMLHNQFLSFKDHEYNRSIRRQKDLRPRSSLLKARSTTTRGKTKEMTYGSQKGTTTVITNLHRWITSHGSCKEFCNDQWEFSFYLIFLLRRLKLPPKSFFSAEVSQTPQVPIFVFFILPPAAVSTVLSSLFCYFNFLLRRFINCS